MGNLDGEGDQFPDTSLVLLEYGHSLIMNLSTGRGSENHSLCTAGRIDSFKMNPCLLDDERMVDTFAYKQIQNSFLLKVSLAI